MTVVFFFVPLLLLTYLQHDQIDPIYGVHVFPGGTETLVRRGGITNYYSIAY